MAENINQNEVKPLSWWERILYVFTKPEKLFENIKHHPKVLFPILTIIIGMIIISLPMIDVMKEAMREELIQDMGNDVPIGIDSFVNIMVYVTIILMSIFVLLTLLVKSGFINAFSGFVNGTGRFKQALSVIAYSYFPVLLGNIIVNIISILTKQNNIDFSLAVFLPDSFSGVTLQMILSNLNIFVIWYQILAIIGISKVYSISKKSSSVLVLGTWILFIIITTSLGALGVKASQIM